MSEDAKTLMRLRSANKSELDGWLDRNVPKLRARIARTAKHCKNPTTVQISAADLEQLLEIVRPVPRARKSE